MYVSMIFTVKTFSIKTRKNWKVITIAKLDRFFSRKYDYIIILVIYFSLLIINYSQIKFHVNTHNRACWGYFLVKI